MEYRKYGDAYIARIDRGEEILESLAGLCRKEGIRLASVQAIGAVDHAVVGIYDIREQAYHKREFNEPMEISSLLGTVTQSGDAPHLHLHVTLCDRSLQTYGGHANALRVSVTCEAVLRTLPGVVDHQRDDETGLSVFRFD